MSKRAVYKSTAAEFLDDLFSGENDALDAVYRQRLANLERTRGEPLSELVETLRERDELPAAIDLERFQPHWLSDEGPMAGMGVDRILRHGFEEAMRIASDRPDPLPIETLWMVGASDNFEVHICEGKRRVTVVFVIPVDRDYGSRRAQSKSWVIRIGNTDPDDDRPISQLDDGHPPVVAIQTSGVLPARA